MSLRQNFPIQTFLAWLFVDIFFFNFNDVKMILGSGMLAHELNRCWANNLICSNILFFSLPNHSFQNVSTATSNDIEIDTRDANLTEQRDPQQRMVSVDNRWRPPLVGGLLTTSAAEFKSNTSIKPSTNLVQGQLEITPPSTAPSHNLPRLLSSPRWLTASLDSTAGAASSSSTPADHLKRLKKSAKPVGWPLFFWLDNATKTRNSYNDHRLTCAAIL